MRRKGFVRRHGDDNCKVWLAVTLLFALGTVLISTESGHGPWPNHGRSDSRGAGLALDPVSGYRSRPLGHRSETRAAAMPQTTPGIDAASRARFAENYGKLPLRFEANSGQVTSRVKFLSRG